MRIIPDAKPIGNLRSFPNTAAAIGSDLAQNNNLTESASFSSILEQAANKKTPSAPADSPPHGTINSQEALALSHKMMLQMNQSLLRIASDTESEQRPASPWMDDSGSIPSQTMNSPLLPSIFRQSPSLNPSMSREQVPEGMIHKLSINGRSNRVSGELSEIIQTAANTYGIDPKLIESVIEAESGFNPNAISPKGAMGLMQLMPGTARELGVTDPMNPTSNVMGGTRYLKKLLDRYEGSIPLALAAYNWGMGNLDSHRGRLPEETRNYVAKITRSYRDGSNGLA